MNKNVPNILTMFRVVLIPFLVGIIVLFAGNNDFIYRVVGGGIFVFASLTDFLDGYLARKYNIISTFGKFMDPLADKLLVCSSIICFIEIGELSAWIVVAIIAREFIVTGLRLIAVEKGIVISANILGKLKTVSQMAMIIVIFFHFNNPYLLAVKEILIWVTLILTVVSAISYIYENRKVFVG